MKVNVRLLPSNNPSHIFLDIKNNTLGWVIGKYPSLLEQFPYQTDTQNQHIYFTIPQSDLEISKIRKGDWYYSSIHNALFQCIHNEEYLENVEKVIATTDKSLKLPQTQKNPLGCFISLPLIPKSFINNYIAEYNKGNIIKTANIVLDVKYDNLPNGWNGNVPCIKTTSNNEVIIANTDKPNCSCGKRPTLPIRDELDFLKENYSPEQIKALWNECVPEIAKANIINHMVNFIKNKSKEHNKAYDRLRLGIQYNSDLKKDEFVLSYKTSNHFNTLEVFDIEENNKTYTLEEISEFFKKEDIHFTPEFLRKIFK